jgi:hypothetical protein
VTDLALREARALIEQWQTQAKKWRDDDDTPYACEWADTLEDCATELAAVLAHACASGAEIASWERVSESLQDEIVRLRAVTVQWKALAEAALAHLQQAQEGRVSVVGDMRAYAAPRRGFPQSEELANRVDGWADQIEDWAAPDAGQTPQTDTP